MSGSKEVLAIVDEAFGALPKPDHFTNYRHCEECAEHDELLRTRDRDTLRIEDVGDICWQPISFSSAEGFAYYMPSLARLALAEPTYQYGWYGETLLIHLTVGSEERSLFAYCSPQQRAAVAALLEHLAASPVFAEEGSRDDDKWNVAIAKWRGASDPASQ
jgi:hypothetical protein